MRALIVTFDFTATAGGSSDLERWRELVATESIPRFEELAGLRHKLFFWREHPAEAVTVYLFEDEEAFSAYAEPVLADPGRFMTTRRFGAPARIEVLNVAGIADGPAAPGGRGDVQRKIVETAAMADSLFDLATIASGQAEPVGGNRLAVSGQRVAMVKKGLLGSSTRAVRERSTVNDVWQGRAEEIVDLAGLSVEAQRAVGAAGSSRPDETFLVIAFDDGAFDDVYWVLQGDAVDVGSAAAALKEPSGSPATAGGASVPPRQHGTRKPLLIVVMAAVAVIGVAAAGIFLLVGEVNGGSESSSDQPAAREAPTPGPMEGDEGGAPEGSDDTLEPPPERTSDASPFEPGGLPAIASQLQRELGYVPRFIRIVASDEFVIMSVRLPGSGTDVDTWAWRDGDLTGPQPERVPDREAVPAQSFTRSDVRLAALASLVKRAEAVPVEGNEVSTAVIQRLLPFDPGVVFLVNAGGPRDSVQLRANAQGRVTEILR